MAMKNADMPAMPQDADLLVERIGLCPTVGTGLTKREMFAVNAMQSLIPVYWNDVNVHDYEDAKGMIKCMMETAVEHADALLAELDK